MSEGTAMKIKIAMLAVLIAAPALAQKTQIRTEPKIGDRKTSAAGSPVWEQYQYEGVPGVIIDDAIQANWGSLENVDLPAGSTLVILREKRLKACRTVTRYDNIPFSSPVWSDCLIDTNDDGMFDQISYTSGGFAKKIELPLPYRRVITEMKGDGPRTFRKLLLFVGSDSGAIRFSYREFANDMARPAFTEDLSVPLGATFPQTIAVKDRVLTVHKIDGMGLSYELVK
jgi:hypothetical protein